MAEDREVDAVRVATPGAVEILRGRQRQQEVSLLGVQLGEEPARLRRPGERDAVAGDRHQQPRGDLRMRAVGRLALGEGRLRWGQLPPQHLQDGEPGAVVVGDAEDLAAAQPRSRASRLRRALADRRRVGGVDRGGAVKAHRCRSTYPTLSEASGGGATHLEMLRLVLLSGDDPRSRCSA